MATVLKIAKDEPADVIKKKLEQITNSPDKKTGFPAHAFTGKIKSFGDGLSFQRKLRDEWK